MKLPKFDFRNIDWFSPKPSKERVVIGLALLAVIAGGAYLGRSGARPAGPAGPPGQGQGAPAATGGGLFKVDGQGPVALTLLAGDRCRTFAPHGWRIIDQNADGTAFTAASPDGGMTASYGGVVLNGGQAAGLYGPQFRSPEALVLYLADGLTHEHAQPEGPSQPVGYYKAMTFVTAGHRGYALFYTFPGVDPGGYGVIMRIAIGGLSDSKQMSTAGAVSAATRCTVTLHPPLEQATYEPPKEDHGVGKTADGSGDLAGTYNAQLGTGWVHDAAGNNYNVDVTSDYHETGPDGPGYYKVNGNDVTKLQPGLG